MKRAYLCNGQYLELDPNYNWEKDLNESEQKIFFQQQYSSQNRLDPVAFHSRAKCLQRSKTRSITPTYNTLNPLDAELESKQIKNCINFGKTVQGEFKIPVKFQYKRRFSPTTKIKPKR